MTNNALVVTKQSLILYLDKNQQLMMYSLVTKKYKKCKFQDWREVPHVKIKDMYLSNDHEYLAIITENAKNGVINLDELPYPQESTLMFQRVLNFPERGVRPVCTSFSADSQVFISADSLRRIFRIALTPETELSPCCVETYFETDHSAPIDKIALLNNGCIISIADKELKIWHPYRGGAEQLSPMSSPEVPRSFAAVVSQPFSSPSLKANGHGNGHTPHSLGELPSPAKVSQLASHSVFTCLASTANGEIIALGTEQGLRSVNSRTMKVNYHRPFVQIPLELKYLHQQFITAIHFSKDDQWLIAGTCDGKILYVPTRELYPHYTENTVSVVNLQMGSIKCIYSNDTHVGYLDNNDTIIVHDLREFSSHIHHHMDVPFLSIKRQTLRSVLPGTILHQICLDYGQLIVYSLQLGIALLPIASLPSDGLIAIESFSGFSQVDVSSLVTATQALQITS